MKKILMASILILAIFLCNISPVFAVERTQLNEQISEAMKKRNEIIWRAETGVSKENIDWLNNNKDYLENHSIVGDVFRYIKWGVIRLETILVDNCKNLYDKTFGFIDLTNYSKVNDYINRYKILLVGLFSISLIALGIMMMVNYQKVPLLRNILIALLVLTSSTYIFSTANSMIASFKGDILGTEEENIAAYTITKNAMIDIPKLANGNSPENSRPNIKDEKSLNAIGINSLLEHDNDKQMEAFGMTDSGKIRLKYRIENINDKDIVVKNQDGMLSTRIGNEFYYRYYLDFSGAFLQLGGLLFVYLALAYKNIRIAFELVVSRILAFFYSTEISNGERLKQILFFIRDSYITMAIGIMCVKLYLIFTGYLETQNLNGIQQGIISIFIAFAVIDGPNLVEKLLGMDAGLRSSYGRVAATFGLGMAAGRLMKKGSASGISGGKQMKQNANQRKMLRNTGKTAYERSQADTRKPTKAEAKELKKMEKNSAKASNGSSASSSSNSSGSSNGSSASSDVINDFNEHMSGRDSNASDVDISDAHKGMYWGNAVDGGSATSSRPTRTRVDNPNFKNYMNNIRKEIKGMSKEQRADFQANMKRMKSGKELIKPPANAPDFVKKNYELVKGAKAAYDNLNGVNK